MFEMMLSKLFNPPTLVTELLPRPTGVDFGTSFTMCPGPVNNGDIYIAGGLDSSNERTFKFCRYNVYTGITTALPDYPGSTTEHLRMWPSNDVVYAILRDQLHYFSLSTNKWYTAIGYPYGDALNQFAASVNTYQGTTYFFGAAVDSAAGGRVLYRHTAGMSRPTIIKNWGSTYPRSLYSYGAINNGTLYTLRADANSGGLLTRTSLDGNTVSTIPIPAAVGQLGFAVAKNNWIYYGVAGGADRLKVRRYNVFTEEFQVMPDLPQANFNGGFALVGGHLYIYAGKSVDNKSIQTDMWRYALPDD